MISLKNSQEIIAKNKLNNDREQADYADARNPTPQSQQIIKKKAKKIETAP